VESDGLDAGEVEAVCRELGRLKAIDYVNPTLGSMSGLGGSVHVVPPMGIDHAYVAPKAARLRQATGLPVFVAGRINQPQIAEQVLTAGQADMCGMTRAMISDPEMANKAKAAGHRTSAPASPATRPVSATTTRAIPSPAFRTQPQGASCSLALLRPWLAPAGCWSPVAGPPA
jgi:2,4-dienoyl-CoA reductase-like NADH-dependent reductase (Old Yellow Enzyme family)